MTTNPSVTTDRVLQEILAERIAQDTKWGEQNHPDGTGGPVMRQKADEARAQCQYLAANGGPDWRAVLLEEAYEALAEDDPAKLRAELVQVAAVAVNWIEAIDRRAPVEEQPAADASEACGKCRRPFDPADNARYHLTPYCRGCVNRCTDSEIADHRCVICA
jgi:hypothetical protein